MTSDQDGSDSEGFQKYDPDASDEEDEGRKVYDIPGGVTVTDKVRRADKEPAAARCPFCAYTAPLDEGGERLVRVHITRENDAAHEHRNGFMPEVHVAFVDENGEFIDQVSFDESEVERDGEITTEMMPSPLTDKQEAVIRKAILNPHLGVREITDELEEEMGEDAPSYSYTYGTLQKFVRRPEVDEGDDDDEFVGYDDLTNPRQRLVDEIMKIPVDDEDDPADPDNWDRTLTSVHKAAGSTFTTLRNVLEDNTELVRQRYARLHSGAFDPPGATAQDSEPEPAEEEAPEPDPGVEPVGSAPDDSVAAHGEDPARPMGMTEQGREGVQRAKEQLRSMALPNYDPDTEFPVDRETLREFAQRVSVLQESADSQRDASPRDSPMRAHADGKLEVLEEVQGFLTRLAEEDAERDSEESTE